MCSSLGYLLLVDIVAFTDNRQVFPDNPPKTFEFIQRSCDYHTNGAELTHMSGVLCYSCLLRCRGGGELSYCWMCIFCSPMPPTPSPVPFFCLGVQLNLLDRSAFIHGS